MESVISRPSGVKVSPLLRIPHPDGFLAHAMKAVDDGFFGFGEAYFTTVHLGHTKGWKRHQKMVLNLIVAVGDVTFFIHDQDSHRTDYITIGESNYSRLTVPPGLCVAFTGVGSNLNLVLNVASIPHDPKESISYPLTMFPLSGDLCENIADRC